MWSKKEMIKKQARFWVVRAAGSTLQPRVGHPCRGHAATTIESRIAPRCDDRLISPILYRSFHGLIKLTPVSPKSSVLRVASLASREAQIAAICASAVAMGWPACSRRVTIPA